MSTIIEQKSTDVKSQKSEIQVNRLIKTRLGLPKEALKVDTRRYNKLENWSNESLTAIELAELVCEGYTIRPGIRTSGNKQEHVTHLEWLIVDFDNSNLQETLDVPLTQQASFYHWSNSYQKHINEKHHLFFQLSRRVTPDEYNIIYNTVFNNHYPFADAATLSNGFLFFGGSPSHKEYTMIGEILDVETILNPPIHKTVSPISQPITAINKGKVELPDDDKVTIESKKSVKIDITNVEKGGYRHQANLWINKIWVSVCENDVDKLYCLYPHNFIDQGSDSGNIAKWGGKNPLSKQPNEPGTGFFVHWGDVDYAPIWRNQSEGTNGNFIEYWHKFGIALYDKKFGDIKYMNDRNHIEYQKVLDDIADYFNVEKFQYIKDESGDYQEVLQELTNKYLKKSEGIYYTYNTKTHIWSLIRKDEVWSHYMGWIRSDYPELVKAFSNIKLVIKAKQKFDLSILDVPEITSKRFSEKKNQDIIPMINGDFNIKTKELMPFNSENWNTYRFSFQHLEVKDSDVREFLDYMSIVYKDEETRKFIINWLAANIMGNAWRLKSMVNVYGTPGSGKSSLGNFLGNLCESNHTTIDVNQFKTKSAFIYQNLDRTSVVTIDEFNNIPIDSWNEIKKISGGESLIEINKKCLQSFKITCKVGLTTFSQDSFTIPSSSDGGILRRIIPIEHTIDMIDDRIPKLLDTICSFDYYEKVFNWLIQLNSDKIIQDMEAYAKSVSVKEKLASIVRDSDDVMNFITENLEVADSSSYITYQQLQEVYKDYLENQNGGVDLSPSDKNKIKYVTRAIRQKANIKEANFNWLHANDKETRLTVSGKQLRVLYGLKLKTQQLAIDNF